MSHFMTILIALLVTNPEVLGSSPAPAGDCESAANDEEGACCFEREKVCFDDVLSGTCLAIDGRPLGAGRSCDGDEDHDGVIGCDDLCPDTPTGLPVDGNGCAVFGACCFRGFYCIDVTDPGDCFAVEGDYQGNQSNCDGGCVFACLADFNLDGLVDLSDFASIQNCLVIGSSSECLMFDFDDDGDADLPDWGSFQAAFGRVCGANACTNDNDCDNGLHCDGQETCLRSGCVAGVPPCDIECQTCTETDLGAVCSVDAIEFTLGVDDLTATPCDDLILAPLLFDPVPGPFTASLQTGDSADGLAGTDTLTATFVGGETVAPSLRNIEGLVLGNIGNMPATPGTHSPATLVTLDLLDCTDVESVALFASADDVAVVGVTSLLNVTANGVQDPAVDLSIQFEDETVTAGGADSLTARIDLTVGTFAFLTPAGVNNGLEWIDVVSGDSYKQNSIGAIRHVQLDGTPNNLTDNPEATSLTRLNFSSEIPFAIPLEIALIPNSVVMVDASEMSASFQLGAGDGSAARPYVPFYAADQDVAAVQGGSGDDVFVFGNQLTMKDASGESESIDGGGGKDAVQIELFEDTAFPLPFTSIETLIVNVPDDNDGVNDTTEAGIDLTGVTGLERLICDGSSDANDPLYDDTLMLSNVRFAPSGTWSPLSFRGDMTTGKNQTFNNVNYTATGNNGSADTFALSVVNRGAKLNTGSATTFRFIIGDAPLNIPGFETVNVTVTDGPATFAGITAAAAGSFTFTASSNLTLGTVAGGTTTNANASAVTGIFSGTFTTIAAGGNVQVGNGATNTVSIAGSPGASITVSTGSGNDTITGSDQADNVTAGAGTDNITTDSATVASADADNVTTGTGTDTVNIFSVAGSSANADLISDFSPGTGGDILSFDLSLLETDGAIDVGEVIDFSELFDGSSVADSDAASIQEIAVAAGATVVAANVNMIAIIGTVATTDALETLLEAGGGAPLTINAAGGDVTSSFPVIYSDATNGFVAVCFAETETANDTTFEATDLVCRNVARLSGNAAITAAEFVAANFDFVP